MPAMGMTTMRARAESLLRQMLGSEAAFREGQWEAIQALVEDRARLLVVQKTGWGKSLVYFLATKLLRDQGAGPTFLVSPLLSLMRNQIAMAERIGVRALNISSANREEWEAIEQALGQDACDILLVSPERLANQRFQSQTLPLLGRGIGLFVVDEAHCISDWGHDFRPDYRRIVRIVRNLPPSVPVLATTATANDRVVADVVAQLGQELRVMRGPLSRPSLRLQAIRLADQAERLAWLAENLPRLPGTGIVYCLTVADCERVATWLQAHGIRAPAYHASLTNEERIEREQALLNNRVKALVATVALGMGFDKPDLGFVVHFQRPGSLVAYYQQIGRAGRAADRAYAILLNGREDDEIQDYFIRNASPSTEAMRQIVDALEAAEGLTQTEIMARVNLAFGKVEQALRLLEIDGAVTKEGARWLRTLNPWTPDEAHARQVMAQRQQEMAHMQAFVASTTCLMEFVGHELDDPYAKPCGRCAVCVGKGFSATVDPESLHAALQFLKRDARSIEPRKQWPSGVIPGRGGRIKPEQQNLEGRVLCLYGDAGWGQTVRAGKYRAEHFGDDLVEATADLVRGRWRPDPAPTWVTAVPSLRHPDLVPDFARRLAMALGLPYQEALVKVQERPEQKSMRNSAQQAANIADAFQAVPGKVSRGPVLLVDDVVDSRWTLTICGSLLREASSGPVYPFALADALRAGDEI